MDKVKERPILFSGEMVRAILDGRKTQTRRVVKPKANEKWLDWITDKNGNRLYDSNGNKRLLISSENGKEISCPYGVPGDLLWVRETHYRWTGCGAPPRANFNRDRCYVDHPELLAMSRSGQIVSVPSIHMPRWASRITLRVVDVRVERVQAISEGDAKAEGVTAWPGQFEGQTYYQDYSKEDWNVPQHTAAGSFRTLWDSINAARGFGWDANPWVWVVSFERVTP